MTDSTAQIQQVVRLAGIEVPENRAEALVVAVRTMEDAARLLAAIDYGEAEPSSRFRAPGAASR